VSNPLLYLDTNFTTSGGSVDPEQLRQEFAAASFPSTPALFVAIDTSGVGATLLVKVHFDTVPDGTDEATSDGLIAAHTATGPTEVIAHESISFDANDAIYPSSNPAVADSRNGHPIIAFDDTTAENVLFNASMFANYKGERIAVDIDWVAKTATTGGVTWGVEVEANAPAGNDIDSDSFAAQQTGTSTTSGTSGIPTRTTITLTQVQADGIESLDPYRFRIQRVVGDGGDDMSGDAQITNISWNQ